MVDRVHGHASGLRSHTAPAVAACLAPVDEFRLRVSDLADGCSAVDGNPAHFCRRKTKGGLVTFLGDQLNARTGASRHLSATTGLELHVVDDRPDRDVANR